MFDVALDLARESMGMDWRSTLHEFPILQIENALRFLIIGFVILHLYTAVLPLMPRGSTEPAETIQQVRCFALVAVFW
jgi:hypothetical protein